MKTVSAGMTTHLAASSTTLAFCFQVERSDGAVFGGTEHSLPLSIDISDGNGSVTYQPAVGFSRTALEFTNDFQPNNLTLSGAFESVGITKADLRAGRYQGAIVKVFLVNWAALADGIVPFGAYLPGEVAVATGFEVQLRGVIDRYSNDIVEEIVGPCGLELGETVQCRVKLDPAAWSAAASVAARLANDARTAGAIDTVKPLAAFNDRQFEASIGGTTGGSEPAWNTTLGGTTVDNTVTWVTRRALTLPVTIATIVSQREFTVVYTGDAPASLLEDGRARFTGGANNGVLREIKSWVLGTKTVKCFQGFPDTIAVSDPLDLIAGCDKDTLACDGDFRNIFNFGGHPNVPSVWVIIARN
jgi:uncharacterized phage protein (TIGR02218 family)